jgi:hypothetical protein
MRRSSGPIAIVVAVAFLACWLIETRARLELVQRNLALTERLESLKQLAAENIRLSNLLVKAEAANGTNATFSELLKLRGVVGMLRKEVESLKTPAQKGSAHDQELAQALGQSKLAYAEEILKRATAQFETGHLSNDKFTLARAEYEIAQAELLGDHKRILEIKAELAGMSLREAERKRDLGLISYDQYEQTKYERNLALAELKGDTLEAARLKFEASEARLKTLQARREIGLESEPAVLRAQLETDMAQAEYRAAENKSKPPN